MTTPELPLLTDVLLRRMAVDQHARGVREGGNVEADIDAMRAADGENCAWFTGVLDALGFWPGRSLVGEEGATAAWIICQHADEHRELQERALVLLTAAVESEEAERGHLALLTDRCLVNRGEKQRFGTQYRNGEPRPIEDPERLDERRAAYGLGPHAEYDARMRQL